MPYRPISLNKRHSNGFSLLELMMVVVILGIIVAIGYPSYAEHVRKGKRSVAKSALLDAANRQEQFFFSNRAYTTNMAGTNGLNFPTSPAYFGEDGTALGSSSGAIYAVSAVINTASCGGAPCFILTATPVTGSTQAGDSCGKFTLNSKNERGADLNNCW